MSASSIYNVVPNSEWSNNLRTTNPVELHPEVLFAFSTAFTDTCFEVWARKKARTHGPFI